MKFIVQYDPNTGEVISTIQTSDEIILEEKYRYAEIKDEEKRVKIKENPEHFKFIKSKLTEIPDKDKKEKSNYHVENRKEKVVK